MKNFNSFHLKKALESIKQYQQIYGNPKVLEN